MLLSSIHSLTNILRLANILDIQNIVNILNIYWQLNEYKWSGHGQIDIFICVWQVSCQS